MAPLLGSIRLRSMEKEPVSNILREEVKGNELPKRRAENSGSSVFAVVTPRYCGYRYGC
jgi:hypothetical protein